MCNETVFIFYYIQQSLKIEQTSCQSRRYLQRLPHLLLLCIDFRPKASVTLTHFYGQDHEFATALLCST